MSIAVLVAGVLCLVLAVGHTTIGLKWVLPRFDVDSLPRTPFGPPSATARMLRVTWHVVGVMQLGVGTLLIALASRGGSADRTLALRWLGTTFAVVAVTMLWPGRRHPRNLLRAPIWMLAITVAALSWASS